MRHPLELREIIQPSFPTHHSSMSGGSSVVFWNQSNRKPAFFRGSIVETTRPIRSDRATRPRWRWVSTQRLGPGGATTIRSGSNAENQAASAFVECESDSTTSEARMFSVKNFTKPSRASSVKAQGTTMGQKSCRMLTS